MTHPRTPERDEKLRSMWTRGESVDAIARVLRMGKRAVLLYRRSLGLADRRVTLANGKGWSDEDLAEVQRRWSRGESATEIARDFPGRTRNGVISLMHRTNKAAAVRKAASTPRQPPKPEPQNKPAVVFGKISVETPAETDARRAHMTASGQATIAEVESATNDNTIRFMDRRTFQCSWPIGVPERPADQMCCGRTVAQGGPRATPTYCPSHARLALGQQPKRKVPTEPSVIRRAA